VGVFCSIFHSLVSVSAVSAVTTLARELSLLLLSKEKKLRVKKESKKKKKKKSNSRRRRRNGIGK
jgi:hypothetical protein